MRSEWGCDGPCERGRYGITCPECNGAYRDCPECEGTGKVEVRRCPSAMQTPDVFRAMRFWPALREGFGAVPGAMSDQAASFLTFVEFLEGEMARIDSERSEGGHSIDAGMTRSGITPSDLRDIFGAGEDADG